MASSSAEVGDNLREGLPNKHVRSIGTCISSVVKIAQHPKIQSKVSLARQ